jgi:NitT/TauT family transport system substrate-binding protein
MARTRRNLRIRKMTPLRLMVSRHSIFYSPLIGGIAGGFFAQEGFEPTYAVVPAGRHVAEFLAAGQIDVAQSAVSASWPFLEKGHAPPLAHFAQINQRDGFLIAAREPDAAFAWSKLAGAPFMFVHGAQPRAMLAWAMHRQGVDIAQVRALDAGDTAQMMAAFRAGQGEYFHEQGPYPQQLVHEGVAHIVASVGEAVGPVAFSSLAASRAWLAQADAPRFMRAYRKARHWVNSAPPAEIAAAEQGFFPGIAPEALARSLEYYQRLGCWQGEVDIDRGQYETALDVFQHSRLIARRHAYGDVVVAPPG